MSKRKFSLETSKWNVWIFDDETNEYPLEYGIVTNRPHMQIIITNKMMIID